VLIDDHLPRYDVSEYHETVVPASAAATYAAIERADLAGSWLVKLLFGLRGLPSLLSGRGERRSPLAPVNLRDIESAGFCRLAEEPGREIVLGVTGSFWKPTGNVARTDPARFREPPPAGTARAAWNFVVATRGPGESLLSTETRVLCADAVSLRSFRRYWVVVGPFSGLIRTLMLRSIAAAAVEGGDRGDDRPRFDPVAHEAWQRRAAGGEVTKSVDADLAEERAEPTPRRRR